MAGGQSKTPQTWNINESWGAKRKEWKETRGESRLDPCSTGNMKLDKVKEGNANNDWMKEELMLIRLEHTWVKMNESRDEKCKKEQWNLKLWENTHKNTEIKSEGEHEQLMEGGMYTDLWEIWDVTLIYSNLLSSKNKMKRKIKKGGKVGSDGVRQQKGAGGS